MLKSFLMISALLVFGPSPQQPAPAPPPAADTAPAPIPADAAQMVNPVKATPESLAHAKKVYGYECAMCHGDTGNGKSDLATSLNLKLKDFTDPASLKDLTDGDLNYIITKGRGQMPGEGGRVKPEEIWNLVVVVRSFAKSNPAETH